MRVKIPARCHCERSVNPAGEGRDVARYEIATSLPLLAMTALIPSPLMGEGWGEGENPRQMSLRGVPAHPELVEGRGNLIVVATAVRRRVFDLIEIATSLPLLAMTALIPSPLMGEGWGEGEFPRNDKEEGE